jgi:hypothetical protein
MGCANRDAMRKDKVTDIHFSIDGRILLILLKLEKNYRLKPFHVQSQKGGMLQKLMQN